MFILKVPISQCEVETSMKKLYAPWREGYVREEIHDKQPTTETDSCVFCRQFQANNDERYFILKRTEQCAVIMNLYPYNAGHVMILPLAHINDLAGLASTVRMEMMELTAAALEVLKKVLKPGGFNIGMNLGRTGGAGIPSHLHQHIVPRWDGDTNFMPVISNTKIVSQALNETYRILKEGFSKIKD